jgi:hypothetical protein
MTLAIAHQEGSCTVLDRLEVALPPFSPDAVHGDRYAAAWSEERFRAHGGRVPLERADDVRALRGVPAAAHEQHPWSCSMTGNCDTNCVDWERRAGRSGRDAVSHRVGGHDDCAASVAGACVLAASQAADDGPVLAANLAPERRGRLLDEREFELLGRGDY